MRREEEISLLCLLTYGDEQSSSVHERLIGRINGCDLASFGTKTVRPHTLFLPAGVYSPFPMGLDHPILA